MNNYCWVCLGEAAAATEAHLRPQGRSSSVRSEECGPWGRGFYGEMWGSNPLFCVSARSSLTGRDKIIFAPQWPRLVPHVTPRLSSRRSSASVLTAGNCGCRGRLGMKSCVRH